ncbi:hypothetical protein B0A55_08853 [Friedmanniomyces simplex]|uniref:Uncharacterized protein n=1 Tax=Friedmanniomyces simplex TaxID=329884 RepID=A0A4U0WZ27_9PEZI|nr:hypothetical protein B0A55_08853 [Friedmanniomyces simplex]
MSSSTATSPTSGVLGPLTTTFTAPDWCTVNVAQCEDTCSVAWMSQSCATFGATNAYACAPSTTEGAPSPYWGFAYSPGLVCPSGLVTACEATYGHSSTWTPFPAMASGETAAVCCPSGYGCPDSPYGVCTSYVSAPATFFVVSCETGSASGSSGAPTYITLPQTVTPTTAAFTTVSAAVVSTWLLSANAVQLRWQSTDLPSPTTASTISPVNTTTQSTASSHPGLSTGAEAGIGVGVGVAGVALLVGLLVWGLRRRKGRVASPISPSNAPLYPHVAAENEPHELVGRSVYELDEQRGGVLGRDAKMMGGPRERHELGAGG